MKGIYTSIHPPPGLFLSFSPSLSFSHSTPLSLSQIPLCRVIRFNIDYTIHFIEEMSPEVSLFSLALLLFLFIPPSLFLFLSAFVAAFCLARLYLETFYYAECLSLDISLEVVFSFFFFVFVSSFLNLFFFILLFFVKINFCGNRLCVTLAQLTLAVEKYLE